MFSMAYARPLVEAQLRANFSTPPPVVTSPDSAVLKLRALLAHVGGSGGSGGEVRGVGDGNASSIKQ